MSPEESPEQVDALDISFVYENWAINYRKSILKKMQNASEKEKRAQAEELGLLNFFKIRRTRDLGFNYHIYSEIQSDDDIFLEIRKTIGEIVSTFADAPHKLREKLKQGVIHLENIIPFEGVPHPSTIRLLETVLLNRNKTRKYLANRIRKHLDEGDYDDVQATKSLFVEFVLDEDQGYEMLKHDESLEGSFYSETYYFQTRAFLLRQVNFFDVYFSPLDPFLIPLTSACASKLRKIIKKLLNTIVEATEDDWLLFNKLMNDLLSISSVKWFLSKSKSEKLCLLNTTYPLDPVINALTQELLEDTN